MEGSREIALRRVAGWAPRGMAIGAQLLAGTRGLLRFDPKRQRLHARLPGGEEIHVGLSPTNERICIIRIDRDHRVEASADLPPHLLERAQ